MIVKADGYSRGDSCTLIELSRVKYANILFCERSSGQDIQILQIQFIDIKIIMNPLQTTISRKNNISQKYAKISDQDPIQLNIKILISRKFIDPHVNQPSIRNSSYLKKYCIEIDGRDIVQSSSSYNADAFKTPVRSLSHAKVQQGHPVSGSQIDNCFCTICQQNICRDEYNQHLIAHRTRLGKRDSSSSKNKGANKITNSQINQEIYKQVVIPPKQYQVNYQYNHDIPIKYGSPQKSALFEKETKKQPLIQNQQLKYHPVSQQPASLPQNSTTQDRGIKPFEQLIPQADEPQIKKKNSNIHQLPVNKLNKILSSTKKEPLQIEINQNEVVIQVEQQKISNFSSINYKNPQPSQLQGEVKKREQSIFLNQSVMSIKEEELKNKKYQYKRNYYPNDQNESQNQIKKRSESLKSFNSFVSIHSGLSSQHIEYVDKVFQNLKNSAHKKSQMSQKLKKQNILNTEMLNKRSPSEKKKKIPKNMLAAPQMEQF